jgi:hypothetical protein
MGPKTWRWDVNLTAFTVLTAVWGAGVIAVLAA